jgi:hypothetical protein
MLFFTKVGKVAIWSTKKGPKAHIPQFDAAHQRNFEIVLNVDGIRVSSNRRHPRRDH